jgi:hypothetical protein
MNLNDPKHPWTRLVTAARQAPDDRDTTAPYGFATRVAALAASSDRKFGSVFERFALRAVGIAGLLAALSVAVNYAELSKATASSTDEEILPSDDPVALVLDVAE